MQLHTTIRIERIANLLYATESNDEYNKYKYYSKWCSNDHIEQFSRKNTIIL